MMTLTEYFYNAVSERPKTERWLEHHIKRKAPPETVTLKIKERISTVEQTANGIESFFSLSLRPNWPGGHTITFTGDIARNAVASDANTANVEVIGYYDNKDRLLKAEYTLLIE